MSPDVKEGTKSEETTDDEKQDEYRQTLHTQTQAACRTTNVLCATSQALRSQPAVARTNTYVSMSYLSRHSPRVSVVSPNSAPGGGDV